MSFGRPKGILPPDAKMGDIIAESEPVSATFGNFNKFIIARISDGTEDFGIFLVQGPTAFPNAPKNRELIVRLKPAQLVRFGRMFADQSLQAQLAEIDLLTRTE